MILEVRHNHEKNIKPNQTEFMYMGSLSRASAFSVAVWLKYAPKGGTQWVSWKHSSVQFSRSVVSDSLRPHELQLARPPCPSPTPGVHPDSRPLSQWCHPAISSSVVPFSSCPQFAPASESFSNESTLHMRWSKYWSFSFSIIPSKHRTYLFWFRDLKALKGFRGLGR